MPTTIHRPATQPRNLGRVSPSVVDPATAEPFTLDQELKPFGAWVGAPIWVPPKDASKTLAETMLRESRPFTSKDKRWTSVVRKHRDDFTQVREFDLFQASIRLPKGRFFVTVTEEKHFDKITDPIPNCVQTRLEEFLSGPAKKRGAKVYYLKPLCIEIGDELILTTREDLTAAITKIQDEVFAEYRRLALYRRPLQAMVAAANLGLAIPRAVVKYVVGRKQKAIDALQAHLEFERRKLALSVRQKLSQVPHCRLHLRRDARANQSAQANGRDRSVLHRARTLAGQARTVVADWLPEAVPWFVALSFTISYVSTLTMDCVNAADRRLRPSLRRRNARLTRRGP